MNRPKIEYYILCRDQARIDQWQARSADIEDVEFHLSTGFNSMYAFIAKTINESRSPFMVVAHDDVIVGRDFARRVHALIDDLEASFPNWGVVGNAGVDTEGHASVYVKDPWCEPQLSQAPEPLVSIDGNLMLINRLRYLEACCEYPDLGGFHGYDVVFSFECLRKGLMVLADGRLRAVHLSGGNRGVYERYIKSDVFQNYFCERFSDRFIPTMLGLHAVSEKTALSSSSLPSLHSLQDIALSRAISGRRPRLAIIDCRAESQTPLSLKIPIDVCPLLDITTIVLSPDTELRKSQQSSGILARSTGSAIGRIVQHAFGNFPHEYFWFVTETFDCPPALLQFVARTLASKPTSLVVAHYLTSAGKDSSPRELDENALMQAIFRAAHFPLSALFIPARPLRDAILETPLARYEVDGALLGAMALAAPGVRLVVSSERLSAPAVIAPVRLSNTMAYGSEDDWEYIERSALFNTFAQRVNPALWALAKDAALSPPPSSATLWVRDIQSIWKVGTQVLRQPGNYLKRAVTLAAKYLVRGDIQGLIREARLFRAR